MSLELDFFEPEDFGGPIKATVQRTGKIGFSMGAAKKYRLAEMEGCKIGRNKGDEADASIYLGFCPKTASGCFHLAKAGDYYYIKAKSVLDSLGIDYTKESIIFNIQEIRQGDQLILKLVRKPKNKKPGQ